MQTLDHHQVELAQLPVCNPYNKRSVLDEPRLEKIRPSKIVNPE